MNNGQLDRLKLLGHWNFQQKFPSHSTPISRIARTSLSSVLLTATAVLFIAAAAACSGSDDALVSEESNPTEANLRTDAAMEDAPDSPEAAGTLQLEGADTQTDGSPSSSSTSTTTPASGAAANYQIDGCPERQTKFVLYASAENFTGGSEQIRRGVERYKAACVIPNLRTGGDGGNLSKDELIEILDVSRELGTYAIIDFNEHFCLRQEGGETVFYNKFWSQTESELKGRVFAPDVVAHPALVGYYVMDEEDKQYGWAGKFTDCGGGTRYIETLTRYEALVAGSDKKLFGVTYPCTQFANSTECDTGSFTGGQPGIMPFERDSFVAPYLDHVDAFGYFYYPYAGVLEAGYDPLPLYGETVRETVRMAEAKGHDSFFVTQGFAQSTLQAGRWPTKDEYVDLITTAEDAGVDWIGFWAEWVSPPSEFDQHWPDIAAAIRESR